MLDLTHCRIVVIGGGAVASRKVSDLIASGASCIRLVAPDFRTEFPDTVQRQIKPYDRVDLRDADLVFAATDSADVNDAVVQDAKAMGIWVNRADGSEDLPGNFATPAKFESGAVTVTVSAGSPALTAMIRDQLQARFDPAWAVMADAMKTLRPWIKQREANGTHRAELFRALATQAAIEVLREKGTDGLKDWIATR